MSKTGGSNDVFEYPEEKTTKNIVGLNTQAAVFIPKFVEPQWLDTSLPKLYEHYTKGGISSGLEATSQGFLLNGKPVTIYSGEMHYWRCHPKLWRERLRKMRACGLNCVSTYTPWNLHEPEKDKYDFGNGDFCLSLYADVATFMRLVYEEDMFLIVKPGPFMSDEWDLGGLPSYMLSLLNNKIRTSDPEFINRVENFWARFLALYKPFQFQKQGPIIAFQIEDEYGSASKLGIQVDPGYLGKLKELMKKFGITELQFTTDSMGEPNGSIDGVLRALSVKSNPKEALDLLKKEQPDKPSFVSKFQIGYFDQWGLHYGHESRSPLKEFTESADAIMKYPASVNFYLFQGGPSWGFMNGASRDLAGNFFPYASSYNLYAPLNEAGDYSDKYSMVQSLVFKYNSVKTKIPAMSLLEPKMTYLQVWMRQHLALSELLAKVQPENAVKVQDLMPMELLSINNKNGQGFGYVVYRKKGLTIKPGDVLKIANTPKDVALVLVDGVALTKFDDQFGFWPFKDRTVALSSSSGTNKTLEILVENAGRAQFGLVEPTPFKGISAGGVSINNRSITDWEVLALDFKSKWVKTLTDYKPLDTFQFPPETQYCPGLYRGTLNLDSEPADTWLDMADWKRGIVFVNGFNLGRHYYKGPSLTLFCPAPLLRKGKNEILVFELYQYDRRVSFSDKPRYLRTEEFWTKKDFLKAVHTSK